jgi:predicted nucleic acid-binding protein
VDLACYLFTMQVMVDIPYDMVRRLIPEGQDPTRAALEALAIEGYRSGALTALQTRELLGFETRLDAGEREAIQLALNSGVETVLMDENEGRRAALRLGLKVTGTVAVLERAGQRGMLSFRDALGRLDKTSFRLSVAIRREFLGRNL